MPQQPPGSTFRSVHPAGCGRSLVPGARAAAPPPSQLPTPLLASNKEFSIPSGAACLWGPTEGAEAGGGLRWDPPGLEGEDPRSVPGQVWEGELRPW